LIHNVKNRKHVNVLFMKKNTFAIYMNVMEILIGIYFY